VLNEANPEIFSISPVPIPETEFEPIMGYFVGATRAEAICGCSEFQLNSSDTDTVRQTLSSVGTDFFWTCANQMNAISYSSQATVYLYQLLVGCTYSDNENDPLCTAPGVVCHEDDLSLVFGTCANPTSAQSAVSTELIKRWTAFATNGNPNFGGATEWSKVAGSGNLNVLLMGSPDLVNQTLYPDLCGPVFGGSVPFNFHQMFYINISL
jgi:carboxylesterase type B